MTPIDALSAPKPPTPQKLAQVILSETSMDLNYNKLVDRLREITEKLKDSKEGEQYWVAIAGGPGSGKTTTALKVAELINQLYPNDEEDFCVVLPMDGFHLSKAKLKELDPDNDGQAFLERRGSPETMDAEYCFELLSQAKKAKCGELPTYSREISDPIPGGVHLSNKHKLVFVEGLYLLWADDERWAPLQELWDEKWFIKCPSRDEQRERLIKRSLENWNDLKIKTWGEGRKGVESKVDANDALNMDIVAPSEQHADVIVKSI